MAKTTNNFFKTEMLLLKILETKERYGYEITQILKELSNGNISLAEGTLYPILYKLVDQEFIEDKKVLIGKRKTRVYYSITTKGKDYLVKLINEYYQMSDCINTILKWKG